MSLNSDFTKRVVIHSAKQAWVESPMPGVKRRMLDRIGDEVARATTVVSYAPDSHFSPHVHTGGEEFIVLEGVFQDEHGDFPAGTYIRNPPESRHTPGSTPGCVIFVKLWQFDLSDRTHIRTDMNKVGLISDPERLGVLVSPLYQDHRERVRMEQWEPGSEVKLDTAGGAEIFVLEGGFNQGRDQLETHSWLRIPDSETIMATAGIDGAKVWIKSGHLVFAQPPQVMS